MKIHYKDKEIELKQSFRALLMYENITNKSFNPQNFTEILTYFYCIIVCCSKDFSIKFNDFVDYIDENHELLAQMTEWLNTELNNNNILKKN